jgi:DNA-binding transcriptional regulator LsrR (DeoR family)
MVMAKQTLSERDLFRILTLRYSPPLAGWTARVPKEVVERLRFWFPYCHRSLPQLRRMVLKALSDPRTGKLLDADFHPPTDGALGEELARKLELKVALVIPRVADLDAIANERYLGLAAFHHFAPQMGEKISLGVSGGFPVHTFLQQLTFQQITRWRFFALNGQEGGQPTGTTADILLGNLLAHHWQTLVAPDAPKPQVVADPSQVSPDLLDWALVTVASPDDALKQKGVVADVLGYRLMRNSSLFAAQPLCPKVKAVPLSLLQRMVRQGKWVIALGDDVDALWATYQMHRSGGQFFNALVTDDRCAIALLQRVDPLWRLADVPGRRQWWLMGQRFRVAHLRYSNPSAHLSNKAIAQRLHLSRQQVPQLLDEALRGSHQSPPLVRLKVRAPSSEQELEWRLLELYGLREVRIVPAFDDDERGYAALGEEATEFLWQLADGKESFCVGISWGRSVLAMMNAFGTKALKEKARGQRWTFIALIAVPPAHSPLLLGTTPQSLLGMLLLRFSTNSRSSPLVHCLSFQTEDTLPPMDAVFTGIGLVAAGKLITDYARELGVALSDRRWYGEMLFQFFDRKGRCLPDPWNGKVQALPLVKLREMVAMGKPVVVLARGRQKAGVVKTAYQAGLFNCLIADRTLAVALLKGKL